MSPSGIVAVYYYNKKKGKHEPISDKEHEDHFETGELKSRYDDPNKFKENFKSNSFVEFLNKEKFIDFLYNRRKTYDGVL